MPLLRLPLPLLRPLLTLPLRLLAPLLTQPPALLLLWPMPLRLLLTRLLPSKHPSAHEKAAVRRLFFILT